MSKVLGLDVGEKKIGVAIGDTESKFAFPRPPLLVKNWNELWEPLRQMTEDSSVSDIIIGQPLNMDGSLGPQAERIDQFIEELQRHTTVPIHRVDERNTTQSVLKEHAGQKLARGEEDSLAAQIILERYLMQLP